MHSLLQDPLSPFLPGLPLTPSFSSSTPAAMPLAPRSGLSIVCSWLWLFAHCDRIASGPICCPDDVCQSQQRVGAIAPSSTPALRPPLSLADSLLLLRTDTPFAKDQGKINPRERIPKVSGSCPPGVSQPSLPPSLLSQGSAGASGHLCTVSLPFLPNHCLFLPPKPSEAPGKTCRNEGLIPNSLG